MSIQKKLQVEAEQKNQQNEKRYMISYTLFEGEQRSPRLIRSPFNNEEEIKKLLFTLLVREMKSELEFSNVEIFDDKYASVFVLWDSEIKSDYKKLEIRQKYLPLKKRYNSNFKRKKFDVANSIKEEMNKLIVIKE